MALLLGANMPAEIVELIVQQLDPISLISLSQTSRSWRAFINPNRHDLVQRLLALELTPEHGGLVPVFDEVSQTLSPPCESGEWKTARYACCGCMKLLTHMMFDNPAILRRPYRKPPPGSVEARKAAVTDWERLEPAARWRRIRERAAREEEERDRWRKVVNRRHEPPPNPPDHHPFALVPRPRDPEAEAEAMRHLVGTGRHKRRCIECLYRNGNMSSRGKFLHDPAGGTPVPVFKSRHAKFPYFLERLYPGLISPPDRLPRYWRALRITSDAVHHTLYTVRCPSCGTWQEYAALRQFLCHYYMGRFGPTDGPVLCDHCHLETHRDPDRLAKELYSRVRECLRDYREMMEYYIRIGWRLLCRDFYSHRSLTASPWLGKHRHVADRILEGLQIAASFDLSISHFDRALDDLRLRFERYRDWLDTELDPPTRSELMTGWFRAWVEDYELIDSTYRWASEQIAWLDSHPRAVLDYVLEKDPHRVQSRKE
ncbi:hypothetical protein L209DRAFT_102774 [Thermothelomyces heterothallicus CBS 203.75]